MDTLFYDGQCPLCMKEIRLLRRIGGNDLRLIDVHGLKDPATWPGIPLEYLLQRLHLLDGEGIYRTGLRAMVQTWSHTPLGFLFRLLLLPGVRTLAEAAYNRWAERRYCRRYGCSITS
ncbi:thiol-disulfide oxidoreductase [Tamilnaduibacter salinus]|uniref:Thiol-disulfide oxidoreductase n=1 Tax=Tamilnaduibacter salinus TaxID=1484056 RepID=A0A2A2I2S2_9GAMM|nr:DCC1-like thiol-disulfide oxidoreductase family protein [Tamilnaduibacter salinus]PAV26321.1 thiol-disulfide oxidoreductase [Tamilnaduibacter salinus]